MCTNKVPTAGVTESRNRYGSRWQLDGSRSGDMPEASGVWKGDGALDQQHRQQLEARSGAGCECIGLSLSGSIVWSGAGVAAQDNRISPGVYCSRRAAQPVNRRASAHQLHYDIYIKDAARCCTLVLFANFGLSQQSNSAEIKAEDQSLRSQVSRLAPA